MFEIHISFDIQSVLFGKYNNMNLYRFKNLVIVTVKQYIIFLQNLFERTCSKKYFSRKASK